VAGELVFGRHAVAALVEHDIAGVLELWVQSNRRNPELAALVARAEVHDVAVRRVARGTLDRMVPGARHQGVVARYRGEARPPPGDLAAFVADLGGERHEPPLLLALDEVTDPHNVGAVLRSAAAAGGQAVLVPRHHAAGLTPAARKVASGAAERVPLVPVPNLARALAELAAAGLAVLGTDQEAGQSLFDADLSGPVVIVLGSEARGLRRLTRERCDRLLRIPARAAAPSLNVSVAAGVCLFEALRQRGG